MAKEIKNVEIPVYVRRSFDMLLDTNEYPHTEGNRHAMYSETVKRMSSEGVENINQLAFWAVDRLKQKYPDVQNSVYIPFIGQESRWSKYGIFSQAEYKNMLRHADDTYVCKDNIDCSNYKDVVIALDDRNHCMVNDSGRIVGQFEDESWHLPRTKSGTANCLRYATRKHNIIIDVKDFTK